MSTLESSYHYGVMRRAIEMIDHGGEALSLEELAKAQGMSSAHFQRIFSKWVGVSPKKFQQYLQLGHAKELLNNRLSTLEASQILGLSGSGRLHDLFLRWEAMTPGEYARRGRGLVIKWGRFETPFGEAVAMGTEKGICGLGFSSELGADESYIDLVTRWPAAQFHEAPDTLRPWIESAFFQKAGETPLFLMGSPLQIKVWEALMRIPSGYVATYSGIAEHIGEPKAVRAVATAIGRNPISWIIPCHRALRKSGGLGGYHWGMPVKRAMLAFESARSESEETPAAI